MNSKKSLVLILISFLKTSLIISCSCEKLYFCEYLKNDDKKVVFRATVADYKEYSVNNTAVYLYVTEIYRDDVGISNIIKLYGSTQSGDCHMFFRNRFTKGADMFIALGLEYNGNSVGFDFVNPDDPFEDYWEFAPHLCTTVVLSTEADKVNGAVAPSISEYPIDQFIKGLDSCNYNLEDLNKYRCMDTDFIIYPNPSPDGKIQIMNGFNYSAIDKVRIYGLDGKVIYTYDFGFDAFQKTELTIKFSGLYLMEIQCDNNTEFRKFIVE